MNLLQVLGRKVRPTFTTKSPPQPAEAPSRRRPSAFIDVAERKKSALLQLAKIYRDSVVNVFMEFGIGADMVTWKVAPRYLTIGLRLHSTNQIRKATSNEILTAIGHRAGLGRGTREPPVEVVLYRHLLLYQFRLPEYVRTSSGRIRLWEDIFLDNEHLQGGIGLTLNDTPVYFEISHKAPHAVVSGTSGSGKTTLLHTIVAQLAAHHKPDELQLALADLKGDFNRFRDLAHLRWQPVSDYHDIEMLIAYVYAEFQRRLADEIRDAPRLVLVIDEADHDRVIGNDLNSRRLGEIAYRGRDYRVNLIIGTHLPNKQTLGDINAELRNRFHGSSANAKQSGQVEGDLALHKLAGEGDFYHLMGGEKIRFQAVLPRESDFRKLPKRDDVPPVPKSLPDVPPQALVDPNQKPPHRPKIEPEPNFVAYYLHHGSQNVSQSQAREVLGLTRTGHVRNRDFAKETEIWLKRLEETKGKWPKE